MAMEFNFGKIEMGAKAAPSDSREQEPNAPFRILFLGDFSGRANRGIVETGAKLAQRRPVFVDRDNFDAVIERMGVQLQLAMGGDDGPHLPIAFKDLDSFHPDKLYERLELFKAFRETRRKLNNPKTFKEAAEEVRKWAHVPEAAPKAAKPAPTEAPPAFTGNLLDAMLDATDGGGPSVSSSDSSPAPAKRESGPMADWNKYISSVVAPYIVPGTDPQQPALVAAVDETIGKQMRSVLHHPDFQTVESAWRGLWVNVKKLETDEKLKLFVLDISKDELAADLLAHDDLTKSGLFKLLVEQTVGTPGAPLWALLAGAFTFDCTRGDMEILLRLALCARLAQAPFLASASPHLVGCNEFTGTPEPREWELKVDNEGLSAWKAVRSIPEARWVGLTAPRFLLRLPYGRSTDAVEDFTFEEIPGVPKGQDLLWGSGAFLCAYLLGVAYNQEQWDLRPGIVDEIDGLPLYVFEDGDKQIYPVGECLLIERAIAAVAACGLIPLVTMKDTDTIRVPNLQSVAEGGGLLAGRWG